MKCDVAIIGGGPAGSTAASLLRKYNPNLNVVVLERERFPRDHVGESQLPAITDILDEIGVWDKVEEADFPVKIGGTYRWGRTDELWDFEFLPGINYEDPPRPAKFEGQRKLTAFQVDRSIYDKVLLDFSKELGATVYEETRVKKVLHEGDRIQGLELDSDVHPELKGATLEAKHYIDCSGEGGIMRRALDIGITAPTALRNIAVWDYWQDAEWAVTLGAGGTRIQILSLGWGWLWFIPITATRTSIGLVMPADYYKKSGKTTEELYAEAVLAEPLVAELTKRAKREGNLNATKDWNFLTDRLAGKNWFLAGDSCGFADPILSAGMTLAHTSGRKVAYTILELEKGKLDVQWLKNQYSEDHRGQIRHHMQFADYWYSANGRFTDLKEYCSEIAKSVDLELDAESAFRWLAAGGFATEAPGFARALSYRVAALKFITKVFSGDESEWSSAKNNVFKLNLEGAKEELHPLYKDGGIEMVKCYRRNGRVMPIVHAYWLLFEGLQRESDADTLIRMCMEVARNNRMFSGPNDAYSHITEALESLIVEGWVTASVNPKRPFLKLVTPDESGSMHPNRDNVVKA